MFFLLAVEYVALLRCRLLNLRKMNLQKTLLQKNEPFFVLKFYVFYNLKMWKLLKKTFSRFDFWNSLDSVRNLESKEDKRTLAAPPRECEKWSSETRRLTLTQVWIYLEGENRVREEMRFGCCFSATRLNSKISIQSSNRMIFRWICKFKIFLLYFFFIKFKFFNAY